MCFAIVRYHAVQSYTHKTDNDMFTLSKQELRNKYDF